VNFVKFEFVKALLNDITLIKCYIDVIWSLPILDTSMYKRCQTHSTLFYLHLYGTLVSTLAWSLIEVYLFIIDIFSLIEVDSSVVVVSLVKKGSPSTIDFQTKNWIKRVLLTVPHEHLGFRFTDVE
jgi:hypothetical protein